MIKPTQAELLASAGKSINDVIAPNLKVLFCGINPGLYSGATGHHFAHPGNRFWKTLYHSGFTKRLLRPDEERELLSWGYGVTNLVKRSSISEAELNLKELIEGGKELEKKVRVYKPAWIAFFSISSFRRAFRQPKASIGEQPWCLADSRVWVLPNPSGLNAAYPPKKLVELCQEFYQVVNQVE
jgi:TDG/mug DNA glycosylase family protein